MNQRKPGEALPVRLRPTADNAIGTTAFFRNRALFITLLEVLKESGNREYRMFFHACSIGAEGYSDHFSLSCYASDKEQAFVDYAKIGVYPAAIFQGMNSQEKAYFSTTEQGAEVSSEIKSCVQFIEAQSFIDYTTGEDFDVVLLLNALIYVPADQQRQAIDHISAYNRRWLVTTAFHAQQIKQDLLLNGYHPLLWNLREIHESWLDRRIDNPSDELRPGICAPWSLPVFSEIEDYEFKYCAIFDKREGLPADT